MRQAACSEDKDNFCTASNLLDGCMSVWLNISFRIFTINETKCQRALYVILIQYHCAYLFKYTKLFCAHPKIAYKKRAPAPLCIHSLLSYKMKMHCVRSVRRQNYSLIAHHFSQNKKNSGYPLLDLAWKSAQNAFKNQMKWILLNERPRDISVLPITWPNLPCLPEREWRVILLFTLCRDEKTHWINILNKCLAAAIK